nr:hypothetical protein Iba_chr03dCG11040 [Ipomoea batatas]
MTCIDHFRGGLSMPTHFPSCGLGPGAWTTNSYSMYATAVVFHRLGRSNPKWAALIHRRRRKNPVVYKRNVDSLNGNRRADFRPWRYGRDNGVVLRSVIFHIIVFAATVHVAHHVLKSCVLRSKFFLFVTLYTVQPTPTKYN